MSAGREAALAVAGMLALAAGSLGGCAATPRAIEAPEIRIASLSLLEARVDAQRFRVGLLVRNTNPVPIPVERLVVRLRIGGGGLLSASSVEPFTLAPGAERTVQLDVESDFVSSASRLLALLQGPDDAIAYDLDGQVVLSRGLTRMLPFSYRGEVPLRIE